MFNHASDMNLVCCVGKLEGSTSEFICQTLTQQREREIGNPILRATTKEREENNTNVSESIRLGRQQQLTGKRKPYAPKTTAVYTTQSLYMQNESCHCLDSHSMSDNQILR